MGCRVRHSGVTKCGDRHTHMKRIQEPGHSFLKLQLEEEMAIHSGILAWNSHGQKSLVGYSPRDRTVEHDSCQHYSWSTMLIYAVK